MANPSPHRTDLGEGEDGDCGEVRDQIGHLRCGAGVQESVAKNGHSKITKKEPVPGPRKPSYRRRPVR